MGVTDSQFDSHKFVSSETKKKFSGKSLSFEDPFLFKQLKVYSCTFRQTSFDKPTDKRTLEQNHLRLI